MAGRRAGKFHHEHLEPRAVVVVDGDLNFVSTPAVPWRGAEPPKRILAIRVQALGDVVITLPWSAPLRTALHSLGNHRSGVHSRAFSEFRRPASVCAEPRANVRGTLSLDDDRVLSKDRRLRNLFPVG